jgi:hypothetical protein
MFVVIPGFSQCLRCLQQSEQRKKEKIYSYNMTQSLSFYISTDSTSNPIDIQLTSNVRQGTALVLFHLHCSVSVRRRMRIGVEEKVI